MADFETAPADWLPYPTALARLLEGVQPLPAENTSIDSVAGRYLAEDVHAQATLPPFDNSAMDGYAVRSGLIRNQAAPVRLPVAGVSLPGSIPLEGVPEAGAVRIMTGGPLPVGFDTVIRVEHTDGESTPGTVILERLDDLGKHVRPGGQDMRASHRVLGRGTRIRPGGVGLLAACGRQSVQVHRRPVVGVLSSGDELVPAAEFQRVRERYGHPGHEPGHTHIGPRRGGRRARGPGDRARRRVGPGGGRKGPAPHGRPHHDRRSVDGGTGSL